MGMTAVEELAKKELKTVMAREGYKAYAKILDLFDVNLTQDPNVVAYTQIDKARIVVNQNLRLNQVSMVVRHEILHNFLEHEKRLIKHLADTVGLDYDKLMDTDFKKLQNQLYSNQISNIAADYEISNRGYTEADKRTVQNLWLNGQKVSGLVTEAEHPDWVDLSVEEMYDKLNKEMTQQEQQMSQQLQNQQGDGEGQGQQSQSGSGQDQDGDGDQSGQSSSQNKSGNASKKGIQIGDMGDPEIQAKEEAERAKQIAKEMQKEMQKGKSRGASDSAGELGDVADEADSLVKDIKDGKADINQVDDLQERVDKIRKAFSDAAMQAEVIAEVDANIEQEKIDRKTKEMLDYMNNGMNRFKNSLSSFIKKATAEQRDATWRRPSRRSTGEPGEPLMKGRQWVKNKKIPKLNVYFDQSGSWSEKDIQEGVKALGILNNYKDRGEIKLNVKFFANNVHINAADARREGGTDLRSVFDDIIKDKPDNVMIMSDSDGDFSTLPDITVPGAVWLLFRNSRSQNVINHIHGRTQTLVYDIE